MNIKYLYIASIIFLASFSINCYGNSQIEVNDVFVCSSDSDCIKGFECKKADANDTSGLCHEKPEIDTTETCIDLDNDGYGKEGLTEGAYLNCQACIDARKRFPNGTPELLKKYCSSEAADCDDGDKLTFPNAPEVCDGRINNCYNKGKEIEEVDGLIPCNERADCRSNNSKIDLFPSPYSDRLTSHFCVDISKDASATDLGALTQSEKDKLPDRLKNKAGKYCVYELKNHENCRLGLICNAGNLECMDGSADFTNP